MVRSAAKRYAVAAMAFLAAATWLGVSVTNGIACLLAFVVALQAVGLYQRRSGSSGRRASSTRNRPPRRKATPAGEHPVSAPNTSAKDRSQSSRRIYDGGRDDSGWPVPSEATW